MKPEHQEIERLRRRVAIRSSCRQCRSVEAKATGPNREWLGGVPTSRSRNQQGRNWLVSTFSRCCNFAQKGLTGPPGLIPSPRLWVTGRG
jgi:hypothetical protein